MYTYQAITIFLCLVPGFFSLALYEMLTASHHQEGFQRLANSIIYTITIYTVYLLIFGDPPFDLIEKKIGTTSIILIDINRANILSTLAIAILLPIFSSLMIKYDIHMRFFRWIKITNKTSRTNAWNDVFCDIPSYVLIHFKDTDRRLFGWPEYYSDNDEQKSLFLTQCKWIDECGTEAPCTNRGIFIGETDNIDFIEFLTSERKNGG